MRERKTVVGQIFCGLWRGIDGTRRIVVNLLFVVVAIVLLAALFSLGGDDIEDSTALVLAPQGRIVDQLSGRPLKRAFDEMRGISTNETLFKDVLDAIESARDDERIKVLVLNLNGFEGAGMSKLQGLKGALVSFKASGKKIVATADNYNQSGYYLAAHADEVYLHNMGMVVVTGFGRYKTYYKEGLDRLGVDVNVFKVGEYKSAVEPFLRDDMSPEAREANLDWLGDLWQVYLSDVAAARGIDPGEFEKMMLNFQEHLNRTGGDAAQAAVDAGLVDGALPRDGVRDKLIELVGENDETHSFNQVAMAAYLEDVGDDRFGKDASGDLVGIVVARGTILDGSQPPGAIGGDSTAALIRQARKNDDVKAVVLRVDSGGGSAFASEVIRRELELTRKDGKPVVVSMGSVAASGGYWISMASDEIWASPTTITGSIGIFGIIPTFQRPMAKYLGMRVDGVGTTPLAGAIGIDRKLSPEMGEMIQSIIDRGYDQFLATVAEGRSMSKEDVDRVARGRVWSGQDALEHGLVDKMGGLDGAVKSAAEMAGITEDYSVRTIEKELDFQEKLLSDAFAHIRIGAGVIDSNADGLPARLSEIIRAIDSDGLLTGVLNDPNGCYAHSMIETD